MQFITIVQQLKIIEFALIFGCITGAGYDIIQLLRYLFCLDIKRRALNRLNKMFFVDFLDFLFFTLVSIAYSIFVYYFNSGRFRLYLFISFLCGYLAYKLMLSKYVCILFVKIASFFRMIFRIAVIKPILYVFAFLFKLISPALFVIKHINNLMKTRNIKARLMKQAL